VGTESTHLQNFKGIGTDKKLGAGFAILRDSTHGINCYYIIHGLHEENRFEHFQQLFSSEFNALNVDKVIIKTVLVDQYNLYAQEETLTL
jgi:hypothetical protein